MPPLETDQIASPVFSTNALIHCATDERKKALLPGTISTAAGSAAAGKKISLMNLGIALDPSPLMVAVGAIIGVRAGVSLMVGFRVYRKLRAGGR